VYDLILFVCSFFAGGMNALAGGGSFLAFPALLFLGVPAINANATTTLAMLPGQMTSAFAFRADLDAPPKVLWTMVATSLIGGLIGAFVMLRTPPGVFVKVIPYLLLAATLIFSFGQKLTARLMATRLDKSEPGGGPRMSLQSILFQLLIATYGGYFGAGIGIVILAELSMMGMTKINTMNSLKTILSSSVNLLAAIIFVFSGVIYWREVLVMILGSVAGGFVLAKWGRLLPPQVLRGFIVSIGSVLTIYFFFK
jgi:uncharacterized membrane protein YfcA